MRNRQDDHGRSIRAVLLSFFLAMSPLQMSPLHIIASGAFSTGLASGLLVNALDTRAKTLREPLTLVTANGKKHLSVEVARDAEQRALGLMFRTKLSDDGGMLFVFDGDQIINMWMKNTYIPQDMIFIRNDGRIVHIAAMTQPLSEENISSQVPARYVLEIAGGMAARLGVKVGDRVRHALIGSAN